MATPEIATNLPPVPLHQHLFKPWSLTIGTQTGGLATLKTPSGAQHGRPKLMVLCQTSPIQRDTRSYSLLTQPRGEVTLGTSKALFVALNQTLTRAVNSAVPPN